MAFAHGLAHAASANLDRLNVMIMWPKKKNTHSTIYRQIHSFVSEPIFDEKALILQDDAFPKISLIMPSYNQVDYIERSILSVLNQKYANFEFVIIDGGSTDGTVEIIKKYEKYLFYWVSERDRGQTHAINKGLEIATGDILAFQNSDDIYLPNAFETISEVFTKNPSVGVVYGDFYHINEDDKILDEQLLINAYYWIQVFRGPQIHNQAAFWKKWVQEKVGRFNEDFIFDMDYEYFTRLLYYNIPTMHLSTYLGAFRHHNKSKTTTLQNISKKELKQVSEYYRCKKLLFRVLPRHMMKFIAKIFKALCHVYFGRLDYVLRDRYKYK